MARARKVLALVRELAGTPAGAQVGRFARLTGTTAFTIWLTNGHVLSWSAAGGALVGAAEVVYRQWRQTQSV